MFTVIGVVYGLLTAMPVFPVAGDRNKCDAGVAWTEMLCCGIPPDDRPYWRIPCSGSPEATTAHPPIVVEENEVLFSVTDPCAGTAKLSVGVGPVPKSNGSGEPLSS
jgi:hypothetical protein